MTILVSDKEKDRDRKQQINQDFHQIGWPNLDCFTDVNKIIPLQILNLNYILHIQQINTTQIKKMSSAVIKKSLFYIKAVVTYWSMPQVPSPLNNL